jgi:hypothetical protein
MFKQLSEKRERALCSMGYLSLRISEMRPAGEKPIQVPHKIYYVNEEDQSFPFNLFECEVSHTDNMFILSNLRSIKNTIYPMNEQSLYFFLGMVFDCASKWARQAKKTRVLIETVLPHCTEHFINCGYDIRIATSRHHGDYIYRGLKSVKDA